MLNNYHESFLEDIPVFFDANGNPQTILEFYGMSDGIMENIGYCVRVLFVLLVMFTILGVLALVYIRHDKR